MAHQRKKQPESVRQQLLDEAARITLEHGFAGLTLQAVARQAGVSKGGLLHHFPSKHALLEGMCDDFLRQLDLQIALRMAQDEIAAGRFARAYLEVMSSGPVQRWAVLSLMLMSEPAMRQRWHEWVSKRLRDDCGGRISVSAWIVWFATDGLWLSDQLGTPQPDATERQAILERLRAETYPAETRPAPPAASCPADRSTTDASERRAVHVIGDSPA